MWTGHFPVASRSSVYSICYAHCSVPHRTSFWTEYYGLLYIVGRLELCCRISAFGLYGSLCRKQQICRRRLYRSSTSLVTIFSVLGHAQQLAGPEAGIFNVCPFESRLLSYNNSPKCKLQIFQDSVKKTTT